MSETREREAGWARMDVWEQGAREKQAAELALELETLTRGLLSWQLRVSSEAFINAAIDAGVDLNSIKKVDALHPEAVKLLAQIENRWDLQSDELLDFGIKLLRAANEKDRQK